MSLSPQMLATTPGARLAEALAELERGTFRAHRTSGQVGPGSIQTGFIQTGAVTADLVAAGAIIAGKLAVGSVVAGNIAAGAVTVGTLAAGAVTAGSIEAGSITTEKLAAGAVTAAKITAGEVNATHLAAGSVTTPKLDAGAVTAEKVAAGAIIAGKIAAGSITATEIQAGSITGDRMVAGTITSTYIAAGSITGDRMAVGTITGDRIQGTTIGAEKLAVTSLSAISANLGTINAGTITGALLRSGASGQRWEADSAGWRGYNAAGEITLAFDVAAGRVTALAGLGGVNLLNDGSFESSDTSKWFTYDGAAPGVTLTRDLAYGRRPGSKGVQAQRLSGATSHAGIAQPVGDKIRFGQTYVLSAWVAAPAGAAIVLFVDDLGGAPGYLASAVNATGTGDWQRVSIAHTPTPGNTAANVYVWRNNCPINGWIYVDDVQFEEGTLPTPYGPRPDELLPDAVGQTEIAPGAVRGGGNEIAGGTIIGTDLIVDAITAREIQASSIGTAELAANAVTAGKILAGEVTTAALAAAAVTAVKVAAGAITADHLTVGAVATSAILNGGFEVPAAADATRPAHWNRPGLYGGSAATVYLTTQAARSGANGLRLHPGAGNSADTLSDPVPANPDEVWTLTLWARTAGTNAGSSPGAYAGVWGTPLGGGGIVHLGWYTLDNTTVPAAWTRYSSQFTVPAGYAHLTVDLLCYSPNTGAALEIDDVELSKATIATEIAPGAVTAAKISADAIDGKVITGATLRTAASGARVALDTSGVRKYDASGNVAVKIGTTDGLDLLASELGTPENDRTIRWLYGGYSVGSVSTSYLGGGSLVDVASRGWSVAANDTTTAQLRAIDRAGAVRTKLVAFDDGVGLAYSYTTAGAQAKIILTSAGTSNYQFSASDRALKSDIEPLEPGALERVRGLRPARFEWREGEGPPGPTSGLIAQEVAGVIPGAVQDAGGQLTMQHGPLLAHIVAAIHELADQAVERPTLEETRDLVLAAARPLADRVAMLERAAGDARLPVNRNR